MPGRSVGATAVTLLTPEADRSPMALRRALEMLQAGERINDELYRATVGRPQQSSLRLWVYEPGVPAIGVRLVRASSGVRWPNA